MWPSLLPRRGALRDHGAPVRKRKENLVPPQLESIMASLVNDASEECHRWGSPHSAQDETQVWKKALTFTCTQRTPHYAAPELGIKS